MKLITGRIIGFLLGGVPGYAFFPGLLLISVHAFAQFSPATQATLQGLVTDGGNGSPVVGARVTVNGQSTFSTSGGVYSLAVGTAGTFPVSCTKAGFDNYTSSPVVFQLGVTSVLNIQLWEKLTPVSNVSVYLDSVSMHVPVSWNAPSGSYELLYDDGIQDNFTVWAMPGNMNALRFTPAGYPAKITGGSVHIGSNGNYPAGSNPLVPFQIRIYDATGTGGTPGASLAGPFEIIPAALGWLDFSLPLNIVINSGSFYIAMVQGGSAPNACGIAIDETNPQFRSYSRFVTGGGPWFPAGGNFMIRARCDGPGGPACLSDEQGSATNYSVYRLRQGEEQNTAAWTQIASTAATATTDSSWNLLPCGPYRWGVKTRYPGNRWSAAAFSNILGKCWTAPVEIHLALSCANSNQTETFVRMMNLAYPDTLYAAVPDSSGTIIFPKVWKGTYKLTVTHFGYDTITQSVAVTAPVLLNLSLLQVKSPPENLTVNDSSLMARWDVPHYERIIFDEKWSSGSLATNSWTVEGGSNWAVTPVNGNPSPSAMFIGVPRQLNYSQSLVSKTIPGQHSTQLKLNYDIYLDAAGTTAVNQLAVELWNGSAWQTVKEYSNAGGNMQWTSEELDISGYTDLSFRMRFRAYGPDSFDINNWNFDNIAVAASEPAQEQANCILGYYFYLGNVIIGYTTKNAFPIPGNQVQYGQTYNACVRALYGSGYSEFTCTNFTSNFLYPVRNLQGNPIENVAYVEWEKPLAPTDTSFVTPPGLVGYTVLRDDSVIAIINDPDSLFFYDPALEPGYYRYGVTARYDLSSYGFPGQVGESLPAGPLHITIYWGRQLPFFESWNSGTFTFNEWRFTPSPGNWVIDQNEGIPAPAARFKWQPPLVNYDYSLESQPFNGLPYNCAAIWLDFDLRLSDRNFTGTEKMIVEAYYNNSWHKKAEISNTGNLPWTNYHLDISPARGKGFRVRFRASGKNSSEILNWYIDNISVYPVCYPATNLSGSPAGNDVRLSWSPPACYGGNILNEGFEGSLFPPPQWVIQTTNPSGTWSRTPAAGIPGVHTGNFSAGLSWEYNRQDEWLIAKNIFVNGDLTFWSYAFQGSLHQDHYYVKVSPDQGATWDVLLDMSALPPYPGANGVNAWITPYHVDLSIYDGETVDIAWHAVDGDGNGLWYPWAIDDCSIGADDSRQQILGYDVYRKDYPAAYFIKINPETVTDTSWLDAGLTPGQYHYFVQSRFAECENAGNSDTILIDVVTGTGARMGLTVSVFPNPATAQFTVTSQKAIDEVRLYETSGRIAGCWFPSGKTRFTADAGAFSAGLYILMIRTGQEVRNFKICIVK